MHARSDADGHCPNCTTPIPSSRIIITYESGDKRAVYAECPGCLDVVHPTNP